jgi:hypothetical protein
MAVLLRTQLAERKVIVLPSKAKRQESAGAGYSQ